MAPEALTVQDGALLIDIMRTKAEELNDRFNTRSWTPRRVDLALWTYGR